MKMEYKNFWKGKRVLITGHTGFKGSWLAIWLQSLGAEVCGVGLEPNTAPSIFNVANVKEGMISHIADVRHGDTIARIFMMFEPEIVFHMAAQPLVLRSYQAPILTYETNVIGTANVLEAARNTGSIKAVVNVTTDKCYENLEWDWGYRENDRLGGYDPYSNSKACSELVTSAYRKSFLDDLGVGVATARAGNVIGGGDWSADRLIPDVLKAIEKGQPPRIRSKRSVRPWQHVLEPLSGYLMLAQRLFEEREAYSGAWNFGPHNDDAKEVQWIVERLLSLCGSDLNFIADEAASQHEAKYLKLDISKTVNHLKWKPRWSLNIALQKIVEWNKEYSQENDMRAIILRQIEEFEIAENRKEAT